jgi:phosphatidylglycerophosphatase A
MIAPSTITFTWMLGSINRTIALGLGSGLSRFAPGTAGTLLAWILYLVMQVFFSESVIVVVIIFGLVYGCWACGICSKDLGYPDHGSIVWDEIIAFWLVLFCIGSESFVIQALAFALFRFLDAIKTWPINRVDRYFKRNAHVNTLREIIWQGFGIIADDLLAAFFTIALILLGMRLF